MASGRPRGRTRWWIWLLGASLVATGCSVEGPRQGAGESQTDSGSAAPASSAPTGPETGRANALVTRVIDGDTVEVRFRGRDLDVRLIGVDTPESVAPGEPVQCFAKAATRYTTDRLEGKRVRLTFDVERTDRYGRTLAYVWLGAELFNETLVHEGYAFASTYPPNVKQQQRFLRAQRDAREHVRGAWGRCVGADGQQLCDPAYPDACIPPPPPDLDCGDVTFRRFTVRSPDPHRFDADGNGIGCES